MEIINLITGDPLIKTINLLKVNDAGESTFNIPTSGVPVTVAIVSADHSKRLTNDVLVLPTEPGSNWAASTIVVNIGKAETVLITEFGLAMLEIQVNDGDEITWFHGVNIINGWVD